MKKSHANTELSDQICKTNGCDKRIKKRHEHKHELCFKCWLKYVRCNPRIFKL